MNKDQELLSSSGVYELIIGEHCYVGSTKRCIKTRIQEHINLLKNNKHYNKNMQKWYNEVQTINYKILKVCSNDVWKEEQYFVELIKPDINIVKHVAKY